MKVCGDPILQRLDDAGVLSTVACVLCPCRAAGCVFCSYAAWSIASGCINSPSAAMHSAIGHMGAGPLHHAVSEPSSLLQLPPGTVYYLLAIPLALYLP